MIYFVNNIMCNWILFLILLINDSSSIPPESSKEDIHISKSITYVKKKYNTLITYEIVIMERMDQSGPKWTEVYQNWPNQNEMLPYVAGRQWPRYTQSYQQKKRKKNQR